MICHNNSRKVSTRRMWWCAFFAALCCIASGQSNENGIVIEDNTESEKKVVNFAAQSAGAVVLESSPGSKGYHNLLNDDKDKYGISPCSEKKWVVIGLSEDIIVKSIVLSNFEKYSSTLKEFQVLVSSSYPVQSWVNLGTYTASPTEAVQTFHMTEDGHWGRYLKLLFLSHYGDEFFCTLSQIKVHGSTMIESLKTEVEKATQDSIDIELLLLQEQHSDDAPTDTVLPEASEETIAAVVLEEALDVLPLEGALLPDVCTSESQSGAEGQQDAPADVEHEQHEFANITSSTIELGGENEQYVHINVTLTHDVGMVTSPDATVSSQEQAPEVGSSKSETHSVANDDLVPGAKVTDNGVADSGAERDSLNDEILMDGDEAVVRPEAQTHDSGTVDSSHSLEDDDDDDRQSSRWSVKGVLGSLKEMMNGGNDSTDSANILKDEHDGEAQNAQKDIVETRSGEMISEEIVSADPTESNIMAVSDENFESDPAKANKDNTVINDDTDDSAQMSAGNNTADVADNSTDVTEESRDSVSSDSTAKHDTDPGSRASSNDVEMTVSSSNSTNLTSLANVSKADVFQNITNGFGLGINATAPFNTTKMKLSVGTCLETLKFADFQSKMKAKLQLQQGNETEKPSGAHQDVFKLLMQKIKTLELNYRIVELHAMQVGECYQLLHADYADKLRRIESMHNTSWNESNVLHDHAPSAPFLFRNKGNSSDELRLVVELLYRNVFTETSASEGELVYLLVAMSLALSLFAITLTVCCLVGAALLCCRAKA